MDYQIDILNEMALDDTILGLVRTAVCSTLSYLEYTSASLSVLLTDDEQLQKLNFEYRQIDSPTDVLSFTVGEVFPGENGEVLYLGDIAISIPYAQREAKKKGHLYTEELQLLAIHGVLHLAGYDHLNKQDKEEMWAVQEGILAGLGLQRIAASIELSK